MAGGTILVLSALNGLYVFAPTNDPPTQTASFLSLFLTLAFEFGWVAFTISFNCWLNLKLSPPELKASKSLAAKSSPIVPWPDQEMAAATLSLI